MAKVLASRGGQWPITAEFVLNAGDTVINTSGVEVDGDTAGVYDIIKLPPGAIVTGGELVVETAFDDAGAATIAIGDSASATRYLAATSIKSGARTALTLTGYVSDGGNIRATVAVANGSSTVGKLSVRVTYVIRGRINEVQTS